MPQIELQSETVSLLQGSDQRRLSELERDFQHAVARSEAGEVRRLMDAPAVREAAEARDAFLAEAAERGLQVEITAVPRPKWRELLAQHLPRKGNEDDAEVGFNIDTFGDGLLPASSPDLSPAFLDTLSDGHFSQLFKAALRVNRSESSDPKDSLSSRLGPISGESLTPQGRLA